MADPGNIETLRKEIEGAGAPDAYIDEEEERHIFARGDGLGVDRATVEAVLNQICRDNGWIREKDVVPDLHDQLDEATRDDGVIDRREFEHCVNYAVAMNMPRKRAMEVSVKYVEDNKLSIKKGVFRTDWFKPLRDQYLR
ncbi:MAG: hypothetical protein ACQESR_00945 [Planctomycetota bacterium]